MFGFSKIYCLGCQRRAQPLRKSDAFLGNCSRVWSCRAQHLWCYTYVI